MDCRNQRDRLCQEFGVTWGKEAPERQTYHVLQAQALAYVGTNAIITTYTSTSREQCYNIQQIDLRVSQTAKEKLAQAGPGLQRPCLVLAHIDLGCDKRRCQLCL